MERCLLQIRLESLDVSEFTLRRTLSKVGCLEKPQRDAKNETREREGAGLGESKY